MMRHIVSVKSKKKSLLSRTKLVCDVALDKKEFYTLHAERRRYGLFDTGEYIRMHMALVSCGETVVEIRPYSDTHYQHISLDRHGNALAVFEMGWLGGWGVVVDGAKRDPLPGFIRRRMKSHDLRMESRLKRLFGITVMSFSDREEVLKMLSIACFYHAVQFLLDD